MQMFQILLHRVNELRLVLLNGSPNLVASEYHPRTDAGQNRTFGRTKSALNLENTLNISFAFLAVPNLSRNRAMI
jgi:hypothetical protein